MLKRIVLTIAFLVAMMASLFAQPGDPQTDPDNPVPLEGIEILLLAGAALGVRRLIIQSKISSEKQP